MQRAQQELLDSQWVVCQDRLLGKPLLCRWARYLTACSQSLTPLTSPSIPAVCLFVWLGQGTQKGQQQQLNHCMSTLSHHDLDSAVLREGTHLSVVAAGGPAATAAASIVDIWVKDLVLVHGALSNPHAHGRNGVGKATFHGQVLPSAQKASAGVDRAVYQAAVVLGLQDVGPALS
jgi:hypothetical protein